MSIVLPAGSELGRRYSIRVTISWVQPHSGAIAVTTHPCPAKLRDSALFSISGSGRHPEAKEAPGRLGGERHTFPTIDMGTSRPITLKPALLPYMAARVSFSGTLCPE